MTNNENDNGPSDVQITGNLTVKLNAEIDSSRKRRGYTITVQCKDASGNASTKTTTVKVPK